MSDQVETKPDFEDAKVRMRSKLSFLAWVAQLESTDHFDELTSDAAWGRTYIIEEIMLKLESTFKLSLR